MTVLPGLIDCHTHLADGRFAERERELGEAQRHNFRKGGEADAKMSLALRPAFATTAQQEAIRRDGPVWT
jgi:imidazolonepropionase-like amidohydrolase